MKVIEQRYLIYTILILSLIVVLPAHTSFADKQQLKLKVVSLNQKVPYDVSPSEFSTLNTLPLSSAKLTRFKAAKNSFISFNLLLNPKRKIEKVSIRLVELTSANGSKIKNKAPGSQNVFNYVNRPIEIFVARYLKIKGLSQISYESYYDERHVPQRFRRPYNSNGQGLGNWRDRPHAGKLYPDILVPSEVMQRINIDAKKAQSFILDIFISKNTASGIYVGAIEILSKNKIIKKHKIQIEVLPYELPDISPAKTMLYIENSDISKRYLGDFSSSQKDNLSKIIDNHFKMARRHGITLFNRNDESKGSSFYQTEPVSAWQKRLNGQLYTTDYGYEGPAQNLPDTFYVIAPYGTWPGKDNPSELSNYARGWQSWYNRQSSNLEALFYLQDESTDWQQQEQWAKVIKQVAPNLKVFLTAPLPQATNNLSNVDIVASWFNFGSTSTWESSLKNWKSSGRQFYTYNGKRPLNGSFATEDDGSALRSLVWSQIKIGIERWFFWNGTYYNNYQSGAGDTNLFKNAQTFGSYNRNDSVYGETGWNYSNGDGVLFYPGTDKLFPSDSYKLDGPLASLRLKLWRSGIEDAKYIELARQKNPQAANRLIQKMMPKTLWEVGVNDDSDPTWKITDISWDPSANAWEKARLDLIDIINSN